MALPVAPNQLSFSDFNTDRGLSATAQIDIDTAAIAYGIPDRPHGMDEFRGRSVPSAPPPPPPPPPAVPTYVIDAFPFVVDEGSSVTFTITTTNIPNGTVLYWTTNAPDDELNTPSAGDFTDGITQGSITINSNSATLVRTLVEDSATEGDEVFVIRLRDGSTSGAILASSDPIIISDTSQSPPPPPPPPPVSCFLLTGISSGTSEIQVCETPRLLSGYFSTTSINSSTLYYGPSTSVSDCSTPWPFNIYLQGDGGYYLWNGGSMSGPFECPAPI